MNLKFTLLSLLCLLVCSSIHAVGQHYVGEQAKKINPDASQVFINEKRNTISFIRLDATANVPTSSGETWLRNDVLKLSTEDNLVQYQEYDDNIGFIHTRYRQFYKSVPVEYGVFYIHNKNGKVVSANGEWYSNINMDVEPLLNATEAYNKALSRMAAQQYAHSREDVDNNKLMILPLENGYKL